MTPEINILLQNMPGSIIAYTRNNPDGSYTIILNAKVTYERQKEAYDHEVWHIQNKDFEKDGHVDYIELVAHGNNSAEENFRRKYPVAMQYYKRLKNQRKRIKQEMEEYEDFMTVHRNSLR